MVDKMKLIAITPELPHKHETEFITSILDAGFDYVHVRKPGHTLPQLREYLTAIPQQYHCRLKLHSHFQLACEFGIAGLHLNQRFSTIPQGVPEGLKLSRSCHAATELTDLEKYEYVFLSPIFDSISKRGYSSKFSQGNLIEIFKQPGTSNKIIALGGIMPSHLVQLSRLGFAGAAFLGFLFGSDTTTELDAKLTNIKTIMQCYNL